VPDREAIVCAERRLTFAELAERSRRLARVLADAAVQPGDAVAISLTNRPEYLEAFFAALLVGATPANLNYHYGSEELAYVLHDCRAAAVVCHADARGRIDAAQELSGAAGAVISVDGDYEDRLAVASGPLPGHQPSGDDRMLLYTGGTTGRPKGVVWRVEDYYLQGWEAARPGTTPPDPRQAMRDGKRAATLLPASPLVHATALGIATSTLNGGGTVVLRDEARLDASALWRLVACEHVQVLGIVGETFARPLLHALDTDPAVAELDLGALRAIVSSGMAFSTTSKQALLAHFPGLRIVDSLGASEALITRSELRSGDVVAGEPARAASTFAAKDNVRVLTDDGRDVVPGSGTEGVLAVAGHLPLGYLNDPEATAQMFREVDGVRYATPGDRALVHLDGRIELLGRGSACVNTGGEKVYPEEVEQVLRTHPAVRDAAVVGVPDERWGEMVTAVLEVADGVTAFDEADVRAHVRAHLAGYKVPKRCFAIDTLARTVAGKPDYRRLRAIAIELASP
jgi:3-oxocholest-4-en-26-oate---CoA ligase